MWLQHIFGLAYTNIINLVLAQSRIFDLQFGLKWGFDLGLGSIQCYNNECMNGPHSLVLLDLTGEKKPVLSLTLFSDMRKKPAPLKSPLFSWHKVVYKKILCP